MLNQRTIAKKLSVTGIGIHSGKKVTLTMHPAEADFGIQFKRVDLQDAPVLKANALTVGATENNTTIGAGVNAVHTVEHLLSALYGFGIENVYCEIDGPEVPIMDGSGASFVFLLKETGIATLNKSKKFLVVLEKVRVEFDDKWAEIEPSSKLVIDSTIVFAHPTIKTQNKVFEFSCENYINEIGRARTFGFVKDVDALKRKGLIKGGSLDNAVVLDDYKVVNPEGLRFQDEFVRHKILDTVGDIALMGYEIAGKVTTYKSGHHVHNLLCRKLLATPSAYEIVSAASLERETVEAFSLPRALQPSFQ
ncbi:UDP-3-O-acyl-N-acetylglucosamine deacetylase [Bacteriovorax stolpii]|uniref:UDP-3-O-acyl-N-acetylglucosamine deacetylase n=1 Tax=Bacteriovorax stolpii TaxID=960 RepID=A0A2K9NWW1_BACTC|nr:UDP-3-O-acyl-N-acetylglucosamine deacetylase [Bacteriovorax stolpii]AUO00009.1 UDP-3-O-[3-hydroxymyristoyl] N-acetylglucosamine deacetylase [Bacteriovorax stolpii]QDK39999.1 UDP-3-O-acyl-N-acetylglucosamine deacetylase [Bacteriovorax stolpii]TDP54100.1 UDP-3-O-[3-hydroxymyristoyl] N-acetylglucosamine deacetylase [Bacteriovorax stolpii]BDT30197.1 UDP-3-O-acyl-N-acetylglucosamine deacetylase [Bacteriovorax sp. HI3]